MPHGDKDEMSRDPQHDVTTAAENIPNILSVIEKHVSTSKCIEKYDEFLIIRI